MLCPSVGTQTCLQTRKLNVKLPGPQNHDYHPSSEPNNVQLKNQTKCKITRADNREFCTFREPNNSLFNGRNVQLLIPRNRDLHSFPAPKHIVVVRTLTVTLPRPHN